MWYPSMLYNIIKYTLAGAFLRFEAFVTHEQILSPLENIETKLRNETKLSGLKLNGPIGVLWHFSIIQCLNN